MEERARTKGIVQADLERIVACRVNNYGNIPEALMSLKLNEAFLTIHYRHIDIEEDVIGQCAAPLKFFNSVLPVTRRDTGNVWVYLAQCI